MQLAASRYVTIEGTTVMSAPQSAADARKALKELRHKKKEFAWLKRSLLRQKRSAQARADGATRRTARKRTWLTRLGSYFNMMTLLPRVFSKARATMDIVEIERDCQRIDEIQHNIDSVILQIEGKLLNED
jgi:hypothetical protein